MIWLSVNVISLLPISWQQISDTNKRSGKSFIRYSIDESHRSSNFILSMSTSIDWCTTSAIWQSTSDWWLSITSSFPDSHPAVLHHLFTYSPNADIIDYDHLMGSLDGLQVRMTRQKIYQPDSASRVRVEGDSWRWDGEAEVDKREADHIHSPPLTGHSIYVSHIIDKKAIRSTECFNARLQSTASIMVRRNKSVLIGVLSASSRCLEKVLLKKFEIRWTCRWDSKRLHPSEGTLFNRT